MLLSAAPIILLTRQDREGSPARAAGAKGARA
jgi:hypothetical protein